MIVYANVKFCKKFELLIIIMLNIFFAQIIIFTILWIQFYYNYLMEIIKQSQMTEYANVKFCKKFELQSIWC